MAAMLGLPERDVFADLAGLRQAAGGHEGVILGVQGEGGDLYVGHSRLGRCPRPVVFSVFEAVQRRGENIVKLIQIAAGLQRAWVKQRRMQRQALHRLGLHGFEKHAGVHLPIEARADRMARRRQIQRRTYTGYRLRDACGLRAHLLRPAHQRIAAQRDADHDQLALRLAHLEAPQDPINFLKIA